MFVRLTCSAKAACDGISFTQRPATPSLLTKVYCISSRRKSCCWRTPKPMDEPVHTDKDFLYAASNTIRFTPIFTTQLSVSDCKSYPVGAQKQFRFVWLCNASLSFVHPTPSAHVPCRFLAHCCAGKLLHVCQKAIREESSFGRAQHLKAASVAIKSFIPWLAPSAAPAWQPATACSPTGPCPCRHSKDQPCPRLGF